MNRRTRVLLAAGGSVCLGYEHVIRPRVLTWGATPGERIAVLPGDELLEAPTGVSTRAIAIDAPACTVWPWLAQMGPSPRGGAYTYDWIENLLGLNMHSADDVLPEYQHPACGDTIALGANTMTLERVDEPHGLAWRSEDGNWVWSFVLSEFCGRTRLISRNRFRVPRLAGRLGMLAMEPGSLVMERKMLLGIKRRAEQLTGSDGAPAHDAVPAPAGSAPIVPRRIRRPHAPSAANPRRHSPVSQPSS